MSERVNVLVVDDNDDDVYFMRRALKAAGLTTGVRFLSDGKTAWRYLRGEAEFSDRAAHPLPELVFLDLKMPFMGGLEVLAAMRADQALKSLRVYILTSSSEERDRQEAQALGIDGYLIKPPTPEVLRPIVASLPRG